ncbi:carbohydrate sulfotransferase 1-like isoform X1 [Symsagittifera roscoffensis]|uniref:carbohydrate sulfotransferase 1-like isoform X1 n=2 Tax=Symsagittifera roscoffensis TaxID=84072 RepID=UPI00307BC59C
MFPRRLFFVRGLKLLLICLLVITLSYNLWIDKLPFNFLNSTKEIYPQLKMNKLESDNKPVYKDHYGSSATVKIQILAYKRGGSSFIGEIFNRNPEAWYFFEPLGFYMSPILPANIRFSWKETESMKYGFLNPKFKLYSRYLTKILNCSFDDSLLKYYLAAAESKNPEHFNPKLFVSKSNALKISLLSGAVTSSQLRERCLEKKITVAKTIRMIHANALKRYLSEEVWVLHLVRDPRAIALSRKLHYYSASLCREVADNLRISFEMEVNGYKWMTIRYEDFAYRPLENSQILYQKLGLKLPMNVTDWIVKNTQAQHNFNFSHHGLSLSTSRDSVAAAEHWISDIPLHLARQYDKDKECQFIYHSLGYKNYSDTVKLHQPNKNTGT